MSRKSAEEAVVGGSSGLICTLHDISFVVKQVPGIQRFGQQLRRTAQEKLVATLKERNQAAVATSLQVFYNLNCLPEIILLAIDFTVRSFIEATQSAIDLDALASSHSELINSVSGIPGASAVTATLKPAKKSQSNFAQMRVAMREMSYMWTSHIHEHAMQINVLQRVVAKKEDPSTHKKFSEVLRQKVTNNSSLQAGRLLDVFWERLSMSLQDLSSEKIKTNAVAAARIYPCLRKAAIETLHNLELLSSKDKDRDSLVSGLSGAGSDFGSYGAGVTGGAGSDTSVFGNALWSPSELALGAIGTTSKGIGRKCRLRQGESRSMGLGSGSASGKGTGEDLIESHGLIAGLRPMRDRYLIAAQHRMTLPVQQMFPDVAGYENAVPSKRDLQALFKALQAELVSAAVEGDLTMLKGTCKEMQKSVHLLVTKVEAMTLTGLDSKKMAHQNGFARTHQQEHNCQLIVLLYQLKESLEKLPALVVKDAMDTPGSSLAAAVAAVAATNSAEPTRRSAPSPHEQIFEDLTDSVNHAVSYVDDLSTRQLLYPLVDSMMTYVRGVLLGLLKEGVTTAAPLGQVANDDVECSRSALLVIQHIPEMLKAHLLSLPKSPGVVSATEEFCLRVMSAYISVAALLRPVSELSRLRTAKDMAAIEAVVMPFCSAETFSCPVAKEFKAFRQLLFAEDITVAAAKSSSGAVPPVPSRARLLSLPFVSALRPSTLIGHLISCGPPQLPSPHDSAESNLSAYIEAITHPSIQNHTSKLDTLSVRSMYSSRGDWRKFASEMHSWQQVQECLDIFLQRSAVADPSSKTAMRGWYEALMDIGGHYFGGSGSSTGFNSGLDATD